jgi:hypothetical protein
LLTYKNEGYFCKHSESIGFDRFYVDFTCKISVKDYTELVMTEILDTLRRLWLKHQQVFGG